MDLKPPHLMIVLRNATMEFIKAHRTPFQPPGYPRDGLSVIKHQQLTRQVGTFDEFAIDTSADLDYMIFSAGSTFVFGSLIYVADDHGQLQSHLIKI